MPTDPFVAVEHDDAPRHRQNLPAGVAYPPSRKSRRNRPGDVEVGQPSGPLLGNPGPNIGYALGLAKRASAEFVLGAHEQREDAAAVVAEIAMKRASQFGRAPAKHDIEIAIALLGYDGSAAKDFVEKRQRAIHEAAHHYQPRRAIIDTLSDDLLRRSAPELRAAVTQWRSTAQITSSH